MWAPGRGLQQSWGWRGSRRLDLEVPAVLAFDGLRAVDVLAMGGDPVVVLWAGARRSSLVLEPSVSLCMFSWMPIRTLLPSLRFPLIGGLCVATQFPGSSSGAWMV